MYLYSERRTRKARNLAADPRLVVHLESGDDVVIVHGTAEDLGHPAQVPDVVAALAAKYTSQADQRYLPNADPDFDVVYAIRPRSAMVWRLDDYEASQRRWTPGPGHAGVTWRRRYCLMPSILKPARATGLNNDASRGLAARRSRNTGSVAW